MRANGTAPGVGEGKGGEGAAEIAGEKKAEPQSGPALSS